MLIKIEKTNYDSGLNKMDKPSKLLIVDDDEEIQSTLKDFLIKKGYEVFSASDGLEGLKLLETEEPGFDLVITDLVMPNISGVGLIAIIKKKFPGLPVIAITGWGEHPEALASEVQADQVLEKPFGLSELEKSLKKLLSSKFDI
ncbi:MAG: response regulator [Desulfobacterales bacterium]